MWFLPLSHRYAEGWFLALMVKLLQNDAAISGLFGKDPFPEGPPTFVRARLYRYRCATRDEHRSTGAWWTRELVGDYLPPITLERPAAVDPSDRSPQHA